MNVINPTKWLSTVRTEHEKEIIPFSQTNYCDITQLEYIYTLQGKNILHLTRYVEEYFSSKFQRQVRYLKS